jgi:hypothetical protein
MKTFAWIIGIAIVIYYFVSKNTVPGGSMPASNFLLGSGFLTQGVASPSFDSGPALNQVVQNPANAPSVPRDILPSYYSGSGSPSPVPVSSITARVSPTPVYATSPTSSTYNPFANLPIAIRPSNYTQYKAA